MLIPPALYKLFVKIEVMWCHESEFKKHEKNWLWSPLHKLYIYSTCILVGQSVWSHEYGFHSWERSGHSTLFAVFPHRIDAAWTPCKMRILSIMRICLWNFLKGESRVCVRVRHFVFTSRDRTKRTISFSIIMSNQVPHLFGTLQSETEQGDV